MSKLPNALSIALWATGACWLVSIIGHLFGASDEWMLPLFVFGLLAAGAEWMLHRRPD